tara:strand:- start:351 stop:1079 length:729 start_codon:yes stop_codon:yes gene_type:complete
MKSLHVIKHIDREGPGIFEDLAEFYGYELITTNLHRGEELPLLKSTDCILLLGGPMGLNDVKDQRYNWMTDEILFIKKAINKGYPIIGICLGAQLMAYSLGGSIQKLISKDKKQTAEIGWSKIYKYLNADKEDKDLVKHLPLDVLHWHSDRILLPKAASLLAVSNICSEQFFKLAPNAYGLQFHAEIIESDYHYWIVEDKKYILSNLGIEGESQLFNDINKLKSSYAYRYNFLRDLFKEVYL